MTSDELDRLAALIAAELQRTSRPSGSGEEWLPPPVRPDLSPRSHEPPVWTGAAQNLGDVAPTPRAEPGTHRDDVRAATQAIRAAAAGHGAAIRSPRAASPSETAPRSAARGAQWIVPVAVSRRHVHLSAADALTLFGPSGLTPFRPLKQPGQFAAEQTVSAVGPSGRIDQIRVVGPARDQTQLELAMSDASRLGVSPPVADSGRLASSSGGVTLEGPAGRLAMERGVIVAARHLHLSVEDARRWHLADGDRVSIAVGEGSRATTWHGVLVRTGPTHATEVHLDEDEARAAGISGEGKGRIVDRASSRATRRRLVTERDVVGFNARGERPPAGSLFTPSARDRARILGWSGV